MRIAPGGALHAVAPGEQIPAHAEIITGQAPLRLTLPDGTRVELSPDSRATFGGAMDLILDRWGKVSPDRLDLAAGALQITAAAAEDARPSLVVSARDAYVTPFPGAKLRVLAVPGPAPGARGLSVAVDDGEARFSTKAAWRRVARGQSVEAMSDGPPRGPDPILPPPEWAPATGACLSWPERAPRPAADCPLGIVTAEREAAAVPIGWREVPGATRYHVEIARDARFADVVHRGETADRTLVAPLPEGRYFARVATQGAGRLPGAPSAPRAIRVVRLQVPAGTLMRGGAAALPRDHALQIADASDLEIAAGRIGFARAPDRIAAGDAPARVRLRATGAASFAEIAIAPSPLHAAIAMNPVNAYWPLDPLTIDVVIDDAGEPIVAGFEPRLGVTVNSGEAKVEWWRRGNHWRARLDPATPPGPWVVRVVARDPHGNEIGRAHAEVIAPPAAPVAAR